MIPLNGLDSSHHPPGEEASVSHLQLVQTDPLDRRCCASCGTDRTDLDPTCTACGLPRPPTGWTRILVKGATVLDDKSGWAAEASLRASGPVLRQRATRTAEPGSEPVVGILMQVSDAALHSSFESRSAALARVRHSSVAVPLATGTHRGRPYRIDRLQPGPRLITALGDFNAPDCIRMARELAEGLALLHSQDTIHGDVCPRSIAMVPDPDGTKAVLVETPAVQAGAWLRFGAPEVVRGQLADTRTDVFGLGLVLWAMLTGKDPREESRATWADERPGVVVPIPEDLGISPHQHDLLRKMLDRAPEVRPSSMEDVLTVLGGGRTVARPAPVAAPPPAGGSSTLLLGLGAAGLAMMAAAAVGLVMVFTATPESGTAVAPTQVEATPEPLAAAAPVAPPPPEPEVEAPVAADPIPEPPVADEPEEAPAVADAVPEPTAEPAAQSSRGHRSGTSSSRRSGSATPEPAPPPEPPVEEPPEPEPAEPPEPKPTAQPTPQPAEEPEAAPESTPAPAPDKAPSSSDLLNGRWEGVVNGRPAAIQLLANPDGTLSGVAEVRVGAKVEQHQVYGKYQLGDGGTASISLGLAGTRTAWSGRLAGTRLSGAVIVNGKARGDFAVTK